MIRLFLTLFICTLPAICKADTSRIAALDRRVAAQYLDTMYLIVTSIGRPDDEGLIGRNREWGDLYSVRFQYGAGRALRHGVATQDSQVIAAARQAIAVGLNSVEDNGAFPATLPRDIFGDRQPGVSDQASAAAFFLSDTCPALLLARPTQQELNQIKAAMTWLSGQHATLLSRDARAPNRLLINALAFGGCGRLLADQNLMSLAGPFIAAALTHFRSDGVFREAGGADTSYQAVNLVAGLDILALGVSGPHDDALQQAIQRGTDWLTSRIMPDGSLNSHGNTRTCADEAFLGRPKSVDLREVFRALAYTEAFNGREIAEIRAYQAWLMTVPDPCIGTR